MTLEKADHDAEIARIGSFSHSTISKSKARNMVKFLLRIAKIAAHRGAKNASNAALKMANKYFNEGLMPNTVTSRSIHLVGSP
jgi:hypothetical protein